MTPELRLQMDRLKENIESLYISTDDYFLGLKEEIHRLKEQIIDRDESIDILRRERATRDEVIAQLRVQLKDLQAELYYETTPPLVDNTGPTWTNSTTEESLCTSCSGSGEGQNGYNCYVCGGSGVSRQRSGVEYD